MAARGARLLLAALVGVAVCAPVALYLTSLAHEHRGGGDVENTGGPLVVPDRVLRYAPAPDTDLVRHHHGSGLRHRVSTDARSARVRIHARSPTPQPGAVQRGDAAVLHRPGARRIRRARRASPGTG